MCQINTSLTTLPTTDVVNVLLMDDWLGPNSAGDPATGRLFTDEIWNQIRDTANATRIRIFLLNLKAAVIEALKQPEIPTGVIIAVCGCTHAF